MAISPERLIPAILSQLQPKEEFYTKKIVGYITIWVRDSSLRVRVKIQKKRGDILVELGTPQHKVRIWDNNLETGVIQAVRHFLRMEGVWK